MYAQINNNTDRTLDVVFSRFKGFLFTITLRQNYKTEKEDARNSFGPLPQGYCERKIPKS